MGAASSSAEGYSDSPALYLILLRMQTVLTALSLRKIVIEILILGILKIDVLIWDQVLRLRTAAIRSCLLIQR